MTYDIHYDYRGHCLQLRGSESEVMEKGRKAFESLVDDLKTLTDMLSGQTTTIARQREELATARLQRDGLQAQLASRPRYCCGSRSAARPSSPRTGDSRRCG
jgi:hypothetical protein